eukprot:TRINITY_DN7480_c0_g1_i2.p1 TRINITY_DN7480_c0_g1~~TRINITY_DN7480_c0_g1_i2.p1  ORF type:complete len:226 (-),score=23.72 TRINITY_DN7480_c0_g1_i2:203-880(-)
MSNGRIYVGEWKDDKRNGFGEFTWPGGDSYSGRWKDSKRHGNGTYKWADGRVYQGEWNEDKRHGYGCSIYPDGHRYEGDYKDGKRHGKGKCTYPNGGRYEGDYKWNKRHGIGTYFWVDLDWFCGEWKKGRRDGKGFLVRAGYIYQQEWREEHFNFEDKGLDKTSGPSWVIEESIRTVGIPKFVEDLLAKVSDPDSFNSDSADSGDEEDFSPNVHELIPSFLLKAL